MPKIPTRSFRVREHLLDRTSFETYGALRAKSGTPEWLTPWDSQLPESWRITYNQSVERIVYVVWSYQTPIAWVLDDVVCGEVVIPDVKYSRTTTQHQGMLYALQMMPGDPATMDARASIRDAAERERQRERDVRAERREAAAVREMRSAGSAARYEAAQAARAAEELRRAQVPPMESMEDPTATLEDRMAALEAETFAQISSTQTLLDNARHALDSFAADEAWQEQYRARQRARRETGNE